MLDPWPACTYTLLVSRASLLRVCHVWPVQLRQPLPPIPVPLLKPDPEIPLSLQPMIEAIYQRSRYERSIDYAKPATPPLGEEDAGWLGQQVQRR